MLKVCLVVDVEGFISLKQKNPMWNFLDILKSKINYLLRNFRYSEKSYYKIYSLVKKYRFPISLMLTGEFKPLGKESFIDYGYHTQNHKPLTFISDKDLDNEIENRYNAISFSAPIGLIHDINEPERVFRKLKEKGYKIIPYRGTMDGAKVASKKVGGIDKPINLYGIKGVYVSAYLSDNGTNWKQIYNEVVKNSKKDAVYLITTHDFVFKKFENLESLLKSLKQLEKQRLIILQNLEQIFKQKWKK